MALGDGDYLAVESKVAAALLADDGEGGLRETGSGPVKTIAPGDEGLSAALGQGDHPVLLVRVVGKSEQPASLSCSVLKSFSVRALVRDRGLDREALEASVRRIAARLEQALREQNATDRQFLGLPDSIEGAEGVLAVSLKSAEFPEPETGLDQVVARGIVTFEISLPCAFRYE